MHDAAYLTFMPPCSPCSLPLQAGLYQEASKAASRVEGHNKAVTILMVANAYEQDDLVGQWCTYTRHIQKA